MKRTDLRHNHLRMKLEMPNGQSSAANFSNMMRGTTLSYVDDTSRKAASVYPPLPREVRIADVILIRLLVQDLPLRKPFYVTLNLFSFSAHQVRRSLIIRSKSFPTHDNSEIGRTLSLSGLSMKTT